MNSQTLSPTCAHHIIGIEKASNLVHILTALAISDLKLQAKHLGLSLVRSNRQTDLICLEESPISLLNLFCAPEHPSTTRRRHTVCLWLRGHRDVGRAQEGNRKKEVRVFAALDLKPIFPSSSLTLKRHTLLGMPMVNVLSANNLDSFLLTTSSHGHTREMRGWVFATFARLMKGGIWIKNRALLAGNNRPPS